MHVGHTILLVTTLLAPDHWVPSVAAVSSVPTTTVSGARASSKSSITSVVTIVATSRVTTTTVSRSIIRTSTNVRTSMQSTSLRVVSTRALTTQRSSSASVISARTSSSSTRLPVVSTVVFTQTSASIVPTRTSSTSPLMLTRTSLTLLTPSSPALSPSSSLASASSTPAMPSSSSIMFFSNAPISSISLTVGTSTLTTVLSSATTPSLTDQPSLVSTALSSAATPSLSSTTPSSTPAIPSVSSITPSSTPAIPSVSSTTPSSVLLATYSELTLAPSLLSVLTMTSSESSFIALSASLEVDVSSLPSMDPSMLLYPSEVFFSDFLFPTITSTPVNITISSSNTHIKSTMGITLPQTKSIWVWVGSIGGSALAIVLGLSLLLTLTLIIRKRRKSVKADVSPPSPEFSTVYAYDEPTFCGETTGPNGYHRNSKISAIYASVNGSIGHQNPQHQIHFTTELLAVPGNRSSYERPVPSGCQTYERPVPSATGYSTYERPVPSKNLGTPTSPTAVENSYEVPRRILQPQFPSSMEPQMYEMSVPSPEVGRVIEPAGYEIAARGVHKEDMESSQGSSDEDTAFIRSIDLNNSNESYWRSSIKYDELRKKVSHICHEIRREDIQITTHLGSGEFGVVNRGIWHSPEGLVHVAVKMLPVTSSTTTQVKLMQEAAMCAQCRNHPNVVQLYGVCTTGLPLMIVQEFLSKGDLLHLLLNMKSLCSEGSSPSDTPGVLLSFCQHVASGMEHLSSRGFLHRDLAARNIMVSEDMICKIGDFGMSKDLDDSDHYVSKMGKIPFKWTAPEAICTRTYSSMSDVWSYGVLMFEIWSMGKKPYEEFRAKSALLSYLEKGGRLPPPPGCPRAIYQLMMRCWHPEKTSRPTFSRILDVLKFPISSLLHWSHEDASLHPKATALGELLEAGKGLYLDLQHQYTETADIQ